MKLIPFGMTFFREGVLPQRSPLENSTVTSLLFKFYFKINALMTMGFGFSWMAL